MFIIGNFIIASAHVLNALFIIYSWLLIIRAILNLVNPDPYNSIVQFFYKTTEPLLILIRKYIPVTFSGFDMSAIIAFLVILFCKYFLILSLIDLGSRIK
jgi:YggT family protein